MTWSLPEQMVIAAARTAGHNLYDPETSPSMDGMGYASCLTCGRLFAIGMRAKGARGEAQWGGGSEASKDPLYFARCVAP